MSQETEVQKKIKKIAKMVWKIELHTNTTELDLIESEIESRITDLLASEKKRVLEEEKTVYQCMCCGFRIPGALRIHDCDWTRSIKIQPILDSISPTTEGKDL